MFRSGVALILAIEVLALVALAFVSSGATVLAVAPIVPMTLVVALLLRRALDGPAYRTRRLSPQAIASHRARGPVTDSPEGLSRSIVERAEEIRRALDESPSDEVRVEMCAIGYRACANDMITLTHLTNETLPTASLPRRLKLRRARKKAIDSLAEAKKALPPGALRAAPQEQQ